MKKRYWILQGLYTVEMVMVQAMYFEYLHEWWYRDDNFYEYGNACAGYRYDTAQHLVIGYERALIRIPCKKFTAQKILLMLYVSGQPSREFDIQVYELLNDFDIRTVTWNNQPAMGQLITTKHITPADFTSWIDIDITQSLNEWFNNHTYPPSYALVAEHEGVNYDIMEEACFETERGVEEWKPYLNITF